MSLSVDNHRFVLQSLYSKRRDGTINLRADCFDGNSCVSMDNVGEGEKYVNTCCTEDTCNNGNYIMLTYLNYKDPLSPSFMYETYHKLKYYSIDIRNGL